MRELRRIEVNKDSTTLNFGSSDILKRAILMYKKITYRNSEHSANFWLISSR